MQENKIEIAIEKLYNEFSSFTGANDRKVDWLMKHVDAMYMQSNENFQRQFDKNDEQHREMMIAQSMQMDNFNRAQSEQMKIFSMTLEHFVNHSKEKIDSIIEAQKQEDIDRNLCIVEIKKDISDLKKAPDRKDADKWRRVQWIFVSSAATLIVSSAIFAVVWLVKLPLQVSQNTPIISQEKKP